MKDLTYIFVTIAILFWNPSQSEGQTINDSLSIILDEFIQEEMDNNSIPGLSACIVKGEEVVWKAAYGMANIQTNTPVSLETKFTLASISKLFTATACAQLWERGILDIDADINDYLPITIINPNFPNIPITTRQLLQHKSSLHDFESDLQLWDEIGDPIFDLETFCTEYFVEGGDLYVGNNWGQTTPGNSNYWYSDAGFTLLGYIVQEASGMPFDEYCESNIFSILEMPSSAWFYADIDIATLAMPYDNNGQPFGYFSVPEYPAAMLKANVEELAHFLIAYTQKGVYKNSNLVEANTFENIVPSNMNNGFGWWGKDTWYGDPTGSFWSHGGFMNGVRTQLNYYPADSTGLIILTNGEGAYGNIQDKMESLIPLFETATSTSTESIPSKEYRLYPNPLTDYLRIENKTSGRLKIEILDINAHIIQTLSTQNNSIQIDLNTLPKGTYWLRLSSKKMVWVEKIVVI